MINMLASLVIMGIFDDIGQTIYNLFYSIFGSELIMGAFLFLIFMFLIFIFGLGFLVGSVVLIPALFLVFRFIPSGRIILAIILGMFVGLGLHRLLRR